ncbi:MAG: response regulator [Treponema sp.]|nr:response regulator [Treponema sp.]
MDANHKIVFLVDDDMTNLTVGKRALTSFYNVYTIGSGKALLVLLEKIMPELILLDIDMPEMDGYETIKQLKSNEKTARIPVIFLTSHNEKSAVVEGISLGAIDYIVKPIVPIKLLRRVNAFFDKA